VELLLAHLTDQRRSPNTVKTHAHDLKDYFEHLKGRRGLAAAQKISLRARGVVHTAAL
jgi:hypothetical protein